MSRSKSIHTIDSFYKKAPAMRSHFDTCFADPRKTNGERFIWDYWHVPNQYTALRTPAYHFFPKTMYEEFHRYLVNWGRENLGCHDISPPWMSCYVDGCEQQLHGDLPHGPWAYVFSLTPWSTREFTGGETMLMKENILSYWNSFESKGGLEQEQIFQKVPAKFNRLVVFDPRIPHGVSRVEGVHDVRKARLVIHGWFVQPKPIITGPLKFNALQRALDALSDVLHEVFSQGIQGSGTLSLKFTVGANGKVRGLKFLTNTLRCDDPQGTSMVTKAISTFFTSGSFAPQKGDSTVVLPLLFES